MSEGEKGEKQIEYTYGNDKDFVSSSNYKDFIERIKETNDELEKEEIIVKNKEGKVLNQEEFNELLKNTDDIIEVTIEKGEKRETKKELKICVEYEKRTANLKSQNYLQLITDLKNSFPKFDTGDYLIFNKKNQKTISNKNDFEMMKKDCLKNNEILNLILEDNSTNTLQIIVKYQNTTKKYPDCNYIKLIDNLQKDFPEFNVSEFDLIDSKNNSINEDNYEKIKQKLTTDFTLTIKKKVFEEKKYVIKRFISINYNGKQTKLKECGWEDLIKEIERQFEFKKSDFTLYDDKKQLINSEGDYEKLKKSNPNTINLYLKTKNQIQSKTIQSGKIKIPQSTENQILDLLLNFKKDLKENIENKLIELSNQIEKINEKIDGLYNDVQELKNKNKNSSYDDEKLSVLETQIGNIEKSVIYLTGEINGTNEKELIEKIIDLNKKGNTTIEIETPESLTYNINDIINNKVYYEIRIINKSDFNLPKKLKLKCERNEDSIVYFNDIIINDGESLISNDSCSINIPLLYNNVKEYSKENYISFYIEKFSNKIFEKIAIFSISDN